MIEALDKKEQKALQEFIDELNKKFGKKIKLMLLYGSKARGDSRSDSDIDIFVLMEKADYKIRDQIVDLAYDFLIKYEVQISPRVIAVDEYKQMQRWQTSFVKNLKKDGIKI